MRPPDLVPDAAVYRRAPRSVFRWMRGSVLVGGPGRPTQRLDGAAALVWMVLDSPAAAPEVSQRIHLVWPDVGGADADGDADALTLVTNALSLLVDAGLICAGGPQDSASVVRKNPGPA